VRQVPPDRRPGGDGPDRARPDSSWPARRSIAAGSRPYSRGALASWIADPQSLKPGNHMPYVATSPDELNALVDYLDSLK
jgi:cytochrome c oxidase subunit 2